MAKKKLIDNIPDPVVNKKIIKSIQSIVNVGYLDVKTAFILNENNIDKTISYLKKLGIKHLTVVHRELGGL